MSRFRPDKDREQEAARRWAEFGVTLGTTIDGEFPSKAAFARKLGVTSGYVTQMISGKRPSAERMEQIVECFLDPRNRKTLRDAYLKATFPMTDPLAEGRLTIEIVLGQYGTGNITVKRALSSLERLLKAESPPEVRHSAMGELVTLLIKADRLHEAGKMAARMEAEAKACCNMRWDLAARWMRLIVMHHRRERDPAFMLKEHDKISLAAIAVRPKTGEPQEGWQSQFASLSRYLALFILRQHATSPVGKEMLQTAHAAAGKAVEMTDIPWEKAEALIIRAEVELAMGAPYAAEETLDAVKEIQGPMPREMADRAAVTRAKMHMLLAEQTGDLSQYDKAVRLLEGIDARAYSQGAIELQRIAARLLDEIRRRR